MSLGRIIMTKVKLENVSLFLENPYDFFVNDI